MLFSQRNGYTPIREILQSDSMDVALRNALWDGMIIYYLKSNPFHLKYDIDLNNYVNQLWSRFLKKPIDTIPDYTDPTIRHIRDFFFKCEWYEVYDFIEFTYNNFPIKKVNINFKNFCNNVLEREMSAYRFVDNVICRDTSEEELKSIDSAMKATVGKFDSVTVHLRQAVQFLSDRQNPDYRNSIKESISAVESLCTIIQGESTTLGKALKSIEKSGNYSIHPALNKAFENLYGYTSDANGIRHGLGLLEETNLSFEDAKFMLVACTAFVNYLIAKCK